MKKELTKKDLVSAYKELDKVVGIEPPIDYDDLSLNDFETELFATYSDLVEEGDKFSKATQAVFDALTEKYGDEKPEETEEEDDEEIEEIEEVEEDNDDEEVEEEDDDEEDDDEEEEEIPVPVKKGKVKPEPVPVKKSKKVVEPEEEDDDDEEEDEKPVKVKPAKKEKKEKIKKESKAFSATMVTRQMVCDNEKVTLAEIQKELAKRGLKEQSPITINVRRMEMINAINFLRANGMLKK